MPKFILIILAFTLVTYANSLSNGFVGDDEVIIVNNSFYKSLTNLPRLLQKDYLTDTHKGYFYHEHHHSGAVAYRPVLSLTYFWDYGIWKLNSFGYHLHNLILHAANAVLVFLIVARVVHRKETALFCSLLFGTHPIQSEVVCNIGFRADLLSLFFLALAFLGYLRYSDAQGSRKSFFIIISLLSFFLALFSKESAVVFPLLILLYDGCVRRKSASQIRRDFKSHYLGFILILGFYLFIYWKVFPNTTLKDVAWLGGSPASHFFHTVRILTHYLLALWFPFGVGILPSFYAPAVEPLLGWGNFFCLFFLVFYVGAMRKFMQRVPQATFFVFWFFVGLIPVLNIIPLANPMAYRFLYLPSVGFAAMIGLGMERISFRWNFLKNYPNLKSNVRRLLIGAYIIMTVSLNGLWKSNYAVASELIHPFQLTVKLFKSPDLILLIFKIVSGFF